MSATPARARAETESPDGAGGSWIRKHAGVCGGGACIRDTRIMAWLLEAWRREGFTDTDILEQYPGLRPQDLALAWEYVAGHPDEIEEAIRENEEA